MKYNKQIHNFSHCLKSIIGSVISFDVLRAKDQLIVLNYHGTQKKFINNFIDQINYLKQHYKIITPNEFVELMKGGKPISGKKVLLTFDDGIKNNLNAIMVLDSLGISAYFFVVPEFVNTDADKQKAYFIKNIRPMINPVIDNENEDFGALSWEDLKCIADKHTIGCHTYTHTLVKDTLNDNDLEKELVHSKTIIENKLGIKVDSFCSINNTLLSIGKKECELVDKHYLYHFTTFGGNNIIPQPQLIRRVNVESHWLKGAFKFALSFIELNRWEKAVKFHRESTK